MEGVFSFFLESSFLGALLFGEKRLGPRGHWVAAFLVFLGSWISGFFIVATNAFMQNPVGYLPGARGRLDLGSLWVLLTNPWLRWEYPHVMIGSVVTASTVMASVGAFYLVSGRHTAHGRTFVRLGVIIGLAAALLMLFPTGDRQGSTAARHQPATLAAVDGRSRTRQGGPAAPAGEAGMDRVVAANRAS